MSGEFRNWTIAFLVYVGMFAVLIGGAFALQNVFCQTLNGAFTCVRVTGQGSGNVSAALGVGVVIWWLVALLPGLILLIKKGYASSFWEWVKDVTSLGIGCTMAFLYGFWIFAIVLVFLVTALSISGPLTWLVALLLPQKYY